MPSKNPKSSRNPETSTATPEKQPKSSTDNVNLRQTSLYILFFLSGISGLVYETIWLRMLNRILGSTVYAMSVVLAAFMAGLALGSYLIGRFASRMNNRLRLYAYLEMGVGITALLLTMLLNHLVPVFRIVFNLVNGERFSLSLFESCLMFLILLVPTCMMGGTLPVLSAHTKSHGMAFTPRIGLLYGLNTLGAVIGVLVTGIYWIGNLGETSALFAGILVTMLVAILAYVLSNQEKSQTDSAAIQPATRRSGERAAISSYPEKTRSFVGFAYGLSGFVSMAYEIIWTRMFQIEIGTSIYAFSIMMGFYLAGIGTGSLLGGRILGRVKNPLRVFSLLQLSIALYSLIGLFIFTAFPPLSLTMDLQLSHSVFMPLFIVFPITFALGVIFPAVSRSYVKNEDEVSRAVGRLYSFNTLGCIAGSLICGFIFVGWLGTHGTLLLLAGLNLVLGLAILRLEKGEERTRTSLAAAAAVIIAAMLGWNSPDPFKSAIDRAIFGYFGHNAKGEMELYYHKESTAATTTAFGFRNNPIAKHLWVNGIGMTALCTETKIMAHLPLMLVESPKDMLVVCFGMGTTTRSAWIHKDLNIDIVELDPETYECFKYFHSDGPKILADPRVHRYVDDGRNYLLMRPKLYDVITMDPAPPVWSAGTVNLYTKEFFSLCKDRLKAGGLMCLWVPPMEASEALMIMRTFQEVFPPSYTWRGPSGLGFYMTGLKDRRDLDLKRAAQAGNSPAILNDLNEYAPPGQSLFQSTGALLELLTFTPEQLRKFAGNAPVITDDHPYTEFPLWRSLYEKAYKSQIVQVQTPQNGVTLAIKPSER
jgi:spermidine synthase